MRYMKALTSEYMKAHVFSMSPVLNGSLATKPDNWASILWDKKSWFCSSYVGPLQRPQNFTETTAIFKESWDLSYDFTFIFLTLSFKPLTLWLPNCKCQRKSNKTHYTDPLCIAHMCKQLGHNPVCCYSVVSSLPVWSWFFLGCYDAAVVSRNKESAFLILANSCFRYGIATKAAQQCAG